ncbi:exopolyphosphatase [Desulfovibrio aerotolerans]|uniref:Exopolyphosphatase n=1 Tax=Solidesulfovibrio aerotolerans TaxID=295255 RepID=A0A7C9IRX4_9BACT|nr:exopolyphosphatase [Solidesulfovibrio aerotolerans]MYL82487.1 exopolyphosphatase [Solidesulfovibrio aerotolerans]
MRLLTRSDFDGLICAVLLKEAGVMDEWVFVHPKDVQDGKVECGPNDILANVPYAPGCGLWFDHHTSEADRLGDFEFTGVSKPLPSCARVIWEYYGGHARFPKRFDEMLAYVDRCDSGDLRAEEVDAPQGWILVSFLMDPRTGLGRYRDYRISNYQLMMQLVELCRTASVEDILADPDVAERVKRYFEQEEQFTAMLWERSKLVDKVLLIDLREQEEIFTGNRFSAYALFPEANVSVQVIWGKAKQNVVLTVGKSIFDRSNPTDIGRLMLSYGGGGHRNVGTCQVPQEQAEQIIADVVAVLNGDAPPAANA